MFGECPGEICEEMFGETSKFPCKISRSLLSVAVTISSAC